MVLSNNDRNMKDGLSITNGQILETQKLELYNLGETNEGGQIGLRIDTNGGTSRGRPRIENTGGSRNDWFEEMTKKREEGKEGTE